jgi:single-strand DNA-binding protein
VTETLFVDIVVTGPQAEAANAALSRGSRVFVQGRLQFNEWTGRDGARHSGHRVAAQRIEFLDRPAGAAKAATAAAAPAPAPGAPAGAKPAPAAEKPGDLPF